MYVLPILQVLSLLATLSIASASVYISEVLWVGSEYSTADEWVELALQPTFTGSTFLLEGVSLYVSDSAGAAKEVYTFAPDEYIMAGSPLIISNFTAENSVLALEPTIVTTKISLLNSGLHLWLQNGSGAVLDEVGVQTTSTPFAGGKAGNPSVYTSMQRINAEVSGIVAANWQDSLRTINIDSAALVLATPGVIVTGEESQSSLSSTSSSSLSSSENSSVMSSSSSSNSSTSETANQSSSISGSSAVLLPSVRINEVLPNPIGSDDYEWIELFVEGSGALVIAGLVVEDDSVKQVVLTEDMLTESGVTVNQTQSGTYIVLTKLVTKLTLNNTSDTIRLLYSGSILDEVAYNDLPEGVSIGRLQAHTGSVMPLCTVTPGAENIQAQLVGNDPIQSTSGIRVDSGAIIATGSLTVNLQASLSGSSVPMSCSTTMSDGFSSHSCNPPAHTIVNSGTGTIAMSITDYCGTTVDQVIEYFITHEANGAKKSPEGTAKKSTADSHCMPTDFTGIELSEIVPNPVGAEADHEWIELYNPLARSVSLCGWLLDDAEEGSKPHALDEITIAPQAYITLGREVTKLALNNSKESVRLFAPSSVTSNAEPTLIEEVWYEKSTEGESFAKRSDGTWLWTNILTPKEPNVFKDASRRFNTPILRVSAALPNPTGKDVKADEWVEVHNLTDVPQNIQGWQLQVGSSAAYTFADAFLKPYQTKRMFASETKNSLSNEVGQVQLLDPDGYVHSVLSWQSAQENQIIRAPTVQSVPVQAKLLRVIDGDTLELALSDPDELIVLPPSVRRAWLANAEAAVPALTVQLLGIHTLATEHPTKAVETFGKEATTFVQHQLEGSSITLTFDQEVWDAHQRVLAYVYVNDVLLQTTLLQHGLAYYSTSAEFAKKADFAAYEAEAKKSQLGMWVHHDATAYTVEQQENSATEADFIEQGLSVSFDPPSGLVASGSLVTITPSLLADVYISVNSGAFIRSESGVTITGYTQLAAYAERSFVTESGAYTVRSNTEYMQYDVVAQVYPVTVHITEVYPAPKSNEPEWIELTNVASDTVHLGGWQLDDAIGKGSKPYVLPVGFTILPKASVIITKEQSGLALNNSNEEVWLISPNGNTRIGIGYGTLSKGQSVIFTLPQSVDGDFVLSNNYCVSDVPNPLIDATCISLGKNESLPDTDQDGLADDYERLVYTTDPLVPDSDNDTWHDGFEIFAKKDPLVFTEDSRNLRLLYKKFIQKNTSVKFTMLKTKPSRVTIKAKGVKQVAIQGGPINLVLPISSGALVHELPPLLAGSYTMQITVTDIAGRTSVLPLQTFVSYGIKATTAKKPKRLSIPSWAKFKQLFLLPVEHGGTTSTSSPLLLALQEQFTHTLTPAATRNYNPLTSMWFILSAMIFGSIVAVFSVCLRNFAK